MYDFLLFFTLNDKEIELCEDLYTNIMIKINIDNFIVIPAGLNFKYNNINNVKLCCCFINMYDGYDKVNTYNKYTD